MKRLAAFALAICGSAAEAPTGFPFTGETLRYNVNWPSGLSLGEAQFRAVRAEGGWTFDFTLEAGIPGFQVREQHTAAATAPDLCSEKLEKRSERGNRKTSERTEFQRENGMATRSTTGGGKSEFAIPACARDALTFLYFTRRELGQGRVPQPERIFFGAGYELRLTYTGEQNVTTGGTRAVSDRVDASLRGPKSNWTFEMFFARDAARTPLLIRVPLPLGSFSLELVR